MNKQYRSRRQFLKRSAHAALVGASGAALSGKMTLMGSALAAQGDYANLPGYKALVCVFLYGGGDSFNLFVPREQALFDAYNSGNLAVVRNVGNLIEPITRFNEQCQLFSAGQSLNNYFDRSAERSSVAAISRW